MTQMTVHDALLADIERTGYYPALVAEALDAAIAAEPIVGFFVHHEPTFEHDEIRRHMTCLVLTPSRFLLSHTDEHPADEIVSTPYASTSVETVALRRVSNVMVTRVVADPAGYHRGDPIHEVVVSLGWGAVVGSNSSRPAATTPTARPTTGTPGRWATRTSPSGCRRPPKVPTPSPVCSTS